MLILTMETCTDTSTLGLVRDGVVLIEAAFPSRLTLAQRLLLRLEWLLGECALAKTELSAIAVSAGPGSFTGVRIGVAAAKTLALGLHIPLVGIPTLTALAYPYRELSSELLAPVINARRRQVYTALFRGEHGTLRRITPDMVLSAEPFADLLRQQADNARVIMIGQTDGLPDGFLKSLPASPATVRSLVTPHALAALALERLARDEQDDPMTFTPIYLRDPAD